ncbi:hypothetical protein [Burkholderia gladioli]|uniref:hypothetical protein n=1 Tax=Burkholderia gladioli TaxID=28095 RepID=UPI0011D24D3A|nr:hypothetical protein [Burkholderia gladioli]MBW5288182.1 hypothetical protein [Burkholderia gladioli]
MAKQLRLHIRPSINVRVFSRTSMSRECSARERCTKIRRFAPIMTAFKTDCLETRRTADIKKCGPFCEQTFVSVRQEGGCAKEVFVNASTLYLVP